MNFLLGALVTFTLVVQALAQRGSYAGGRPQGYKDKYTPQTSQIIADRFGEDNRVDGTTQRLPIAAHGDVAYVDRLNSLPLEKRPFWFINYQAIEAAQQSPFPIVQPLPGPSPFAGSRP